MAVFPTLAGIIKRNLDSLSPQERAAAEQELSSFMKSGDETPDPRPTETDRRQSERTEMANAARLGAATERANDADLEAMALSRLFGGRPQVEGLPAKRR